jgi:exo-1,4-beta-D-glucosaminidase
LPQAKLEASATIDHDQSGDAVHVRLHNPSNHLAFQIQLGIHEDQHDDEVLPVFWEDNYFSLLPGESRVVVARYPTHALQQHPELEVEGWNVDRLTVALVEAGHDARR